MSRWGIAFRVSALFVMTLARRIWNFLYLAARNASAEHSREVGGTAGSPFSPRRYVYLPKARTDFRLASALRL